MAIISFTPKDALKSMTIPGGFYRAMFTEIAAPKTSQSGKSESYYATMVITEGKFKDKQLVVAFNTATPRPGPLNGMTYTPTDFLLHVDNAITGREIDPVNYDLNTESLLQQEFDAKIEQTTVDGALVNVVVDFFKVGTGTSKPAFGA